MRMRRRRKKTLPPVQESGADASDVLRRAGLPLSCPAAA